MTKLRKDNKFIKLVPSSKKNWITNIYYGCEGKISHGHLTASGAVLLGPGIIVNDVLNDILCQEVIFHRDLNGRILLDSKLF